MANAGKWKETTIRMIKRILGSTTTGHSYHARRRDMMLMVLTHNIRILSPTGIIVIRIKVFYRAVLTLFLSALFCRRATLKTAIDGIKKRQ